MSYMLHLQCPFFPPFWLFRHSFGFWKVQFLSACISGIHDCLSSPPSPESVFLRETRLHHRRAQLWAFWSKLISLAGSSPTVPHAISLAAEFGSCDSSRYSGTASISPDGIGRPWRRAECLISRTVMGIVVEIICIWLVDWFIQGPRVILESSLSRMRPVLNLHSNRRGMSFLFLHLSSPCPTTSSISSWTSQLYSLRVCLSLFSPQEGHAVWLFNARREEGLQQSHGYHRQIWPGADCEIVSTTEPIISPKWKPMEIWLYS